MNNMCLEPFEPFVFEYGFLGKNHNLFVINFPPNLFPFEQVTNHVDCVGDTINHHLHA
jgi:hypothetical protein